MQAIVETKKLRECIGRVQAIANQKSSMPILNNVLLETKGDHIEIRATDLETDIVLQCDAQACDYSAITVNAKQLYKVLKEIKSFEITLQTIEGNQLEIVFNSSSIKLATLPAEDYPVLPSINNLQYLTLHCDTIKEMIEKTLFAVSTDNTRYNLCGILFEYDCRNDRIKMVSTDGHRLALCERDIYDSALPDSFSCIIPTMGIKEIAKLVKDGKDSIRFALDGKGNAVVERDDIILFIRLIDGTFPDYNRVIPTKYDDEIRVFGPDLKQAVKTVSACNPDKQAICFDLTSDHLTLDCNGSSENLTVHYPGDFLKIGFNGRYILDVLDHVDNAIRFCITETTCPVRLDIPDDPQTIYVVMPMRI